MTLSTAELGHRLGLTAFEYELLEGDAGGRVPKRDAEIVTYYLAAHEQQTALAASGLSECDTLEKLSIAASGSSTDESIAHGKRVLRHISECATCQAREQFIRERFPGELRYPLPTWLRIFSHVQRWADERPEWLRPAIWSGLAVMAMTAARVIFIVPAAMKQPKYFGIIFGALALAGAAGAAGGLVYSIVGRPLIRVRGIGPYLAGIVSVMGYLAAAFGMLAILGQESSQNLTSSAMLVSFILASTLFGVVVGHSLLRPIAQRRGENVGPLARIDDPRSHL